MSWHRIDLEEVTLVIDSATASRLIKFEGWTDAERSILIEQQTRTALALIVSRRVANPKIPIPTSSQVAVPTGKELVRLLTKPQSG